MPPLGGGKADRIRRGRSFVVELGGHRQLRVVRAPQAAGADVHHASRLAGHGILDTGVRNHDRVGIVRARIGDEQRSRIHLCNEVGEELVELPILVDEPSVRIGRDEAEESVLVDAQDSGISHGVTVVADGHEPTV